MRNVEKRTRPALAARWPGERLEATESYPTPGHLQAAGTAFAERWRDTAERFISSFFHALTDDHGPAVGAVNDEARRANLTIGPEDMPSPEHWSLVALLAGHAEVGLVPSVASVLQVARLGGWPLPLGGGDQLAEVRDLLEREVSAAGIVAYARKLSEYGRRARRVRRLWRVLRNELGACPWPDGILAGNPTVAPHESGPAGYFSDHALARVFGEGGR
jgi:hypothetical protein